MKPKTAKQLAAQKRWKDRGNTQARREKLFISTEYRDLFAIEALSRKPPAEDLGFFPKQELPNDWEELLP